MFLDFTPQNTPLLIKISKIWSQKWNQHPWFSLNPKFQTFRLNFNFGVFLYFTPQNLPLLIKISKIWYQKWNQYPWFSLSPKFQTFRLNFNFGVFLHFTPQNPSLLIKISKIWYQRYGNSYESVWLAGINDYSGSYSRPCVISQLLNK